MAGETQERLETGATVEAQGSKTEAALLVPDGRVSNKVNLVIE
jgi:hypothetical protein